MVKKFVVFLIITALAFLLFNSVGVGAQTPFRTNCDACGLCYYPLLPTPKAPSNWKQCASCLYPNIDTNDPYKYKTLEISMSRSPNTSPGEVSLPQPGKFFTEIGCIQGVGDFVNTGSVGVVVLRVISVIQQGVFALAFIYLVYGSYILLTSGGSLQKVQSGRSAIKNAVLGLLFSIFGIFILRFFASLLKIPGFS